MRMPQTLLQTKKMSLSEAQILEIYDKSNLNLYPSLRKVPVGSWGEFQTHRISRNQLQFILSKSSWDCIGIILGLEGYVAIDIDNHSGKIDTQPYLENFKNAFKNFLHFFYFEKTPSGGYHIIFRSENPRGNTKLLTQNNETIIELKGKGGYLVIAPTPKYEPIGKLLWELNLETLPADIENEIYYHFAAYDIKPFTPTGNRNLDDFDLSDGYREILYDLGWQKVRETEEREYWRRPGKTTSYSATFHKKLRTFYVFSNNAPPFEANHYYYPHQMLHLLKGRRNGISGLVKKYLPPGETEWEKTQKYIIENLPPLRFNDVLNRIEYEIEGKYSLLDEKTLNDWFCACRNEKIKIGYDLFVRAIEGNAQRFNPFADFFNNLPPWDGKDHLDEWMSGLEIEVLNPKFKDWPLKLFIRWFIGMIHQMLGTGKNDHLLFLLGRQGIGKTTFWSYLVPPELETYYAVLESAIDPANKDSKILLAEKFLINLDELESQKNTEIETLKSMLTLSNISLRRPYARYSENYPRRASFCGSGNHTDFLRDPTGNRRYFPIKVKSIKPPEYWQRLDVLQLWAQMYFLYQAGAPYTLIGAKELDYHEEYILSFWNASYEEEKLLEIFEPIQPPIGLSHSEIFSWVLSQSNNNVVALSKAEITDIIIKNSEYKNINRKLLNQFIDKHFVQIFPRTDSQRIRKYILRKKLVGI